ERLRAGHADRLSRDGRDHGRELPDLGAPHGARRPAGGERGARCRGPSGRSRRLGDVALAALDDHEGRAPQLRLHRRDIPLVRRPGELLTKLPAALEDDHRAVQELRVGAVDIFHRPTVGRPRERDKARHRTYPSGGAQSSAMRHSLRRTAAYTSPACALPSVASRIARPRAARAVKPRRRVTSPRSTQLPSLSRRNTTKPGAAALSVTALLASGAG